MEYGSPNGFSGNVVRYNISQNDARKNGCGAISFYVPDAAHPVTNTRVYNNSVYIDANNLTNGTPSALFILSEHYSGVQLSNNIFYAAPGVDLVNSEYSLLTSQILLLNNLYFSSSAFHIRWNGSIFNSLEDWISSSPGQETAGGNVKAISVNPLLIAPGSGGTVAPADGGSFRSLFGYSLQVFSPAIDKGISISTAGNFDFYGNSIPQASSFDIGAGEYVASTPLPARLISLQVIPEGNTARIQWTVSKEFVAERFEVQRSQDGINYHPIASIKTNNSLDYSYLDLSPGADVSYRIGYVYPDGTRGVSGSIKLANKPVNRIQAFFQRGAGVHVTVTAQKAGSAKMMIYNESGMLLHSSVHPTVRGTNNLLIREPFSWKQGTYIVSVFAADASASFRFLITP